MSRFKITSWNIAHLDRLLEATSEGSKRRRAAVVQEIREIDPDVLLILEGPKGAAAINRVSEELLGGDWVPITFPSDAAHATLGKQWIWFLVRRGLRDQMFLLEPATWKALCGDRWDCHFWGDTTASRHKHYRHPQVLVYQSDGFRAEFIGLHLKSKFVNHGQSMWNDPARRDDFVREALKARIKMTTEATNVRHYVDMKFGQIENPAIFVMGDLNDGPGKEYFEDRYLFFDLVSNLQGEVFFARRFLNHALFDVPQELRWTVKFKDFVDPTRDPHILLDHIMFTQPLIDGSLPWRVGKKAGTVEHEIHDLINAQLRKTEHTSDHRPVSVTVDVS